MVSRFKDERGWGAVAGYLPDELESWVFEMGAIERKRKIRDGESLLRLAMVYSGGLSLRETATWAREIGIAELSDVALMKRFRKLGGVLSRCVQSLLPSPGGMGLCAVDATTVSRQVAKGTDFRVHLGWDEEGAQIAQVRLTDASVGESLQSLPWRNGEVLVADRAYAGRAGIAKAVEAGAQVIVRISVSSTPLRSPSGTRVDLLSVSRTLKVGECLDLDVETIPDTKKGIPSVPGRLIVIRKEPGLAEKERKKARREAAKKGQRQRPETGESAEYTFLFTTLTRQQADAQKVLSAYRHRWQIEMLFKRAKGIVGLGETQARDKELCVTMILAKLLALLLVEKMRSAFSPWGYDLPRKAEPVENL
jgi:hypothetical protein